MSQARRLFQRSTILCHLPHTPSLSRTYTTMPVTIIAAKPATEEVKGTFRYIVNLTDPVFRGFHHGKKKHDDDFEAMLERARAAGVKSMIITGGSLHESREALRLAETHGLYATVGCHPTRSGQFDKFRGGPEAYLEALDELLEQHKQGKGRVVAVGECGLDYDRTHFASPDTQKTHFHFVSILQEEGFGKDGGRAVGGKGGVVHSFTGTIEELNELVSMAVLLAAKAIRPERFMLETDAPWCTMTSTHASKPHLDTLPASLRPLYFPPATRPEQFVYGRSVKGRNEPCAVGGVAWVIHKLNGVPFEKVTEKAWKNTAELFGLEELK
ncbi:hypothetical protein EDD18DRAFT_1122688 [Armillaria luteobubalina]|uniref:Mg-dependent DNase n=1 Tax=Armillaria luteobubalina TaxID=153913 RepID=A0AA39V0P8_9AGAR|nr:hypothetical protein EDD18DRAFT_1122688 [Armillaria luteobubalina]